jgi:serine/threonine protein kinase/tetratricopeptide (TPR) repeat protein
MSESLVPPDLTRTFPPETPKGEPGTVIGPYKLLQQIGEGGMGAVYVAEQEHPVKRRVAIKVIKPGMDSAQVIRRFEAERQALAMMEHTNIAKVLDAGTIDEGGRSQGTGDRGKDPAGSQHKPTFPLTPSARPYFVMELVKGEPITKYCNSIHLPIRDRLEMFVQVCSAIQHAHQKGIIHRDIKPSNVLVCMQDGKPVPKVIDFGVAKALHQKLNDQTMYTEIGQIVGTLEYMSPEQAELSAMDIDTRTDIYALGVLLYELITGSTPLDRRRLRQAAYTEAVRIIREEEPPKPSTRLTQSKDSLSTLATQRRTEPSRLTKEVRGDLDWITMKCLEKDRTRRYETATGLARDLQRYLRDEPVEACPPTTGYRLRKYLRRHKGPVVAALVVLLALIGGTVGTTIGLLQARQAEAQANEERDKALHAEAAAKEDRDKKTEAEKAARQEAEKAKAFGKFLTEDLLVQAMPDKNAPSDRVTLLEVVDQAAARVGERFSGQPLLEAEIRRTLGQIYSGLAKFDEAERHFNAALAVQRRLLGEDDPETYRTMDPLGYMLVGAGRLDAALQLLQPSAAGLSRALGPDHPDAITAQTHLLCAYYTLRRLGEFVSVCEETLRRARAAFGPEHLITWYSLMHVGQAYRSTGRFADGLALNEEALRLALAKLGPDNTNLLLPISHLIQAYREAHRFEDAERLAADSVRIAQTKFGPDHALSTRALLGLAGLYWMEEKYDLVEPIYRKQAASSKKKSGADSLEHINALVALATILRLQQKYAEAEGLFDEALAKAKSKLGPDHLTTWSATGQLALLYQDTNRLPQAIALHEKAIRWAKGQSGPVATWKAAWTHDLASDYQRVGRWSEAVALYEEAIRLLKGMDAYTFVGPAWTNDLAAAYQDSGKPAQAESLYREVLEFNRQKDGPQSAAAGAALANLGQNLIKQQKYADAEASLREALTILEQKQSDGWRTFYSQSLLGGSLLGLNKYSEAEPLLLKGYEGMKRRENKIPTIDKVHLTDARERLVRLYDALNKPNEASKWRKEAEVAKKP